MILPNIISYICSSWQTYVWTYVCVYIMSQHMSRYVDICGNPTWDNQECHPDSQPGASFSKLWPLIQSLVSQGCHWYQKPRRETLNNLKNTPKTMFLGPLAPGQARMVFSHNFWHRLIQPTVTKPCADSSPYLHGWIELSSISPIQVSRNLQPPETTPRPGQYLLIALITWSKLFKSKFWPLIQTCESLGCHCYHIQPPMTTPQHICCDISLCTS